MLDEYSTGDLSSDPTESDFTSVEDWIVSGSNNQTFVISIEFLQCVQDALEAAKDVPGTKQIEIGRCLHAIAQALSHKETETELEEEREPDSPQVPWEDSAPMPGPSKPLETEWDPPLLPVTQDASTDSMQFAHSPVSPVPQPNLSPHEVFGFDAWSVDSAPAPALPTPEVDNPWSDWVGEHAVPVKLKAAGEVVPSIVKEKETKEGAAALSEAMKVQEEKLRLRPPSRKGRGVRGLLVWYALPVVLLLTIHAFLGTPIHEWVLRLISTISQKGTESPPPSQAS